MKLQKAWMLAATLLLVAGPLGGRLLQEDGGRGYLTRLPTYAVINTTIYG